MLTEYIWQANTALSHSRHLQVWPEPEETRMRAKKFMTDMLYKEQKCIKKGGGEGFSMVEIRYSS